MEERREENRGEERRKVREREKEGGLEEEKFEFPHEKKCLAGFGGAGGRKVGSGEGGKWEGKKSKKG